MADQESTGSQGDGREEAEKLLVQAETGGGRTAARPSAAMGIGGLAPSADQPGSVPLGGGFGEPAIGGGGTADAPSGMSGEVTNDASPGGGATGDRPLPDTVGPDPAKGR